MKKFLIFVFALSLSVLILQANAFAFNVNWGNSWDPGDGLGYYRLGDWFLSHGYFSDITAARTFAQTGYIGSPAQGGADPYFFWPVGSKYSNSMQIEIVLEEAGYALANDFGYYPQANPTAKVQIFSGSEGTNDWYGTTPSSPKFIEVSQPFGFYLYSDYRSDRVHKTYWYTDRALNYGSQSHLTQANPGTGDAQGLIYELVPGSEYLIALEDLDATNYNGTRNTDNDYNDMLVRIKIHHNIIPEPATLSLLGLGLLGILGLRKRKVA